MKKIRKMIGIILGCILVYYSTLTMIQIPQKRVIRDATSIQKTINEQRDIANPVELTGLTKEVVEINKEIALWKTINDYFPSIVIDQFDELNYVE